MDVAPTTRGRGRPAQLSREQIVRAAATFDDLDAMTMRDLADRLEVSHSALYRWVKNRDELFDLISDVVVDGVLRTPAPDSTDWQSRLRHLGWAVHDEFLALHGYASHLARPHPHNAHSVGRLRLACVELFTEAGATDELAEQSWYVFITSMIGWLAVEEQPSPPGHLRPRFELFLDVLIRGLPAG